MKTQQMVIGRRIALSRMALLWERLWRGLWPAVTIGGLFLALALSDWLPHLPGGLHVAVLTVFAVLFISTLLIGLHDFRWPRRDEARRRLEARGLHRPLTAVNDRLAQGAKDPVARALWEAHTRKMQEQAGLLRGAWPRPGVPSRDLNGLRALPVLALVIAGAAAWNDPGVRLSRAFDPAFTLGMIPGAVVNLWVTPPDYTGLAPFYRETSSPSEEPIRAPEGSELLVLVHGADEPSVWIAGDEAPPERLDDGSHRLRMPLTRTENEDGLVIADDGDELAAWPLNVAADAPPDARFSATPSEGPRWRLKVPVEASDDFGVDSVRLELRRPEAPADIVSIDLPLAGTPSPAVSAQPLADLTPHPWAGLPVQARLVATDALGQEGRSSDVEVTLPERQFNHPVARELVRQRKALVVEPEERFTVATGLDAVASRPGTFAGDAVVFLGLRVAANRLRMDMRDPAVPSVVRMLWDIALRVEEGDLAAAEKVLAEAEQNLQQALDENASDAEIQQRIEELRQALQEYMQALMDSMPEMQAMDLPQMPMATMDPMAMDQMLQQMQEMSEIGAREAAQQMMQQLQEMLQALRNAQPMPQQSAQAMQDMMRRLNELAEQQEKLLGETFKHSREQAAPAPSGSREPQTGELPADIQEMLDQLSRQGLQPQVERPQDGQQGQQGQQSQQGQQGQDGEGQSLAEQQEALRKMLGDILAELAEQTGQVPEGLGGAEIDMRGASEALSGGQWSPAEEAQGRALAALRQGTQQAMQQMMQAMGQGMMMMPGSQGQGQQGRQPGVDPLGRGYGGLQTEGVEVPDKPDVRRAHELMMELRRRSNETGRPIDEQDYIRRLLKQF